LLGTYEDFPPTYHSISRFSYTTPAKKLQRTLIQSLYRLNRSKEGPDLPEFTQYNIKVELELGVADGLTFNYIDKETSKRCRDLIRTNAFQTLDLLCIVRYYAVEKASRNPLRFDYHMLRFQFSENEVELRVYHERGTRRLPIDELASFITQQINKELSRKKMNPLEMTYTRSV